MLIRKPAAEVFEAFVDPDVTTHFWFTKGSGRLEVRRRLLRARTRRYWSPSLRPAGPAKATHSSNTPSSRLKGSPGRLQASRRSLEHGLELGLVADKNPDALVSGTPIVQVKENAMLQDAPMYAYLPAHDVARARNFYEGTLGFKPAEQLDGGVTYRFGNDTACFLYATPHAGTSKASQAFWQVEDIEREVAELQSRGVQFERYDAMPGKRSRDGVVIEDGGAKAAWFKDTEGNILAIVQDV
jgi:catechol 2,3-dioxygenase-like lactoylglutathione lyase family enzyme